jgi:Terminase large subunit, T4likevirus-type, N-terminal
VSFPTVDALERELRKLEAHSPIGERPSIPDYPVEFAISLGIEPDEWQVEVLASDHPRKILCCGRQTGKSTVAAILAIHKALTRPGSTVLVVAPGERQAKLLFSKALSLYRQAGYPLPARSERRTGLELSNGSMIEALPAVERTTRGYSVDLLIVDEAAAVPDMDYHGILPALIATQGEQVLLSTPRGRRGFFHEIWHSSPSRGRDGDMDGVHPPDDWLRVIVRSDEVSRIRPEDLEVFRHTMPEQFFRQEFYCEWLETEGSLFSSEDIEAALAAGEDVAAIEIADDEW